MLESTEILEKKKQNKTKKKKKLFLLISSDLCNKKDFVRITGYSSNLT